ncbi:MAG: alpha/beta hydrolase [Sphingomonadaceae bacterium]
MTPDQAFVEAQKTSPKLLCPSFDPLPDLRELTVPGLWVLGEQDWIVPVGTTTHKLDTLRREGKPYEYRKVPEVGHLLYGNSEPVDDEINSWLSRVTMQ